jgi:hypothetical protein
MDADEPVHPNSSQEVLVRMLGISSAGGRAETEREFSGKSSAEIAKFL